MDAPPFFVRLAEPADAPAFASLSTQLGYPSTVEDAGRRLAAIREASCGEVFVAAEGSGPPIGWIHVFIAIRLESAPFAEIGGLVVDEARRGEGVGEALVRAGETWACGRGVATIRVRSNVLRTDAHGFYERRGYSRMKTQQVFTKDLSAVDPAPRTEARPGSAPK